MYMSASIYASEKLYQMLGEASITYELISESMLNVYILTQNKTILNSESLQRKKLLIVQHLYKTTECVESIGSITQFGTM